jgi:hypothetical protein
LVAISAKVFDGKEDGAMKWCRGWQAMPIVLAGAGMLSGCYYDPNTGYTYAYPPPYGYTQQQPGAPEGDASFGAPPPESGAPPGGPPMQAYGGPPAQGYGPPAQGYGGPPAQGYGGPPAQGYGITRDQFVQRAVQRASRQNRNPQLAAQRAGAVFDQIDINHSGAVTQAQIRAWRAAHMRAPNPGEPPPEQ